MLELMKLKNTFHVNDIVKRINKTSYRLEDNSLKTYLIRNLQYLISNIQRTLKYQEPENNNIKI